MDPIAKTSLLTAAMRARESIRDETQGRLFVDPYAKDLAGSEGEELLQKALAESGEQPAIAVRTAFMDNRIQNFISQKGQQIVLLAAGMDTRSFRLALPAHVAVFELDRKEVFDYKNPILKPSPRLV